ncbi:centromere protein O [Triplophysa rosa]|uniref:Centromere protein O n=1 Tax=Triplophysa rosa TaxID=992332 RepID=A0A9W8C0D7_TRIRA|nr:centromere protein O [Triplophysa rosa]KAI7805046.1 centromere protein O [Triplophysa rosa]
MDDLTQQGVLGHLMALERGGLARQDPHQSEKLEMLIVTAVTLRTKRDQLKRQVEDIKILKDKIKSGLPLDDDDEGPAELQRSLLTAWRMQLKDLQHAHHLIGGYDVVECKEGRSVCVCFHTAFEGVYLDTYNMELDMTRTVQISRHNIPPSIPLERFAKQNLQKDFKAFLETLSQNLNALAARKQQLSLIKELVGSVEVMESNQLCNTLVLMCKAQGETFAVVLCTLQYRDLAHYLPTHVCIESEDETLSESEQWKKNRALFLESPAHMALLTMKRMGSIV